MAASRGGGSRSRGEGNRSVEPHPDLRHALDTAMVRSRLSLQRFRALKGFREANPGAGRRRGRSVRALVNDKQCAAGPPQPQGCRFWNKRFIGALTETAGFWSRNLGRIVGSFATSQI